MTASDMENVWAIADRIMPCLLVRLRRKMAVTAVFQSNQNDRVTLKRHREDIFLGSHSHRDALFPVFLFFIFYFTLVAWLPGFLGEGCLQNRAHETIRPCSWGSREGDWLLHIICFSDKSFFQAVSIKGCSLPTGCRKESLTQLLKSGVHGVWGAVAHWAAG